MIKEFATFKLCEITNILAGGDLPDSISHEKTKQLNIPIFSNGEKNNGLYGYTDTPKVTEPAVTISARGSKVGFAALRKQPYFPIVRILSLIPDPGKLDVDFLYYNLKLNRQSGTGSGQPQITIPDISNRTITIPPLYTQRKIASVLSALDSRIELNNRINAELEAMTKTIYDYWFVQFEFPIEAALAEKMGDLNLTDKPYKSSGGKMVWNDELKREVPEGWDSILIENCLLKGISIKKIPTAEILEKGRFPVIDQSTDFIAGFTNDKEAIIKTDEPRIIFGDHTRILKLINFDFARGADGTQVMLSNNKRMPQHLFFNTLLKIDLSNYGYARHYKFLKDISIILPDEKVSKKFETTVSPFYKMIRKNIFQNQKLTELRDWLLPMLMNGQVKAA